MAATPKNAGNTRRRAVSTVDAIPLLTGIGYRTSTTNVAPGQIIFAQGATSDAVYFLRSGSAKVSVLSKSGQEAVILILEPGDFFGEGCVHGATRRTATVTAITECMIDRVGTSAMRQALHSEPKLTRLMMDNLLRRNLRLLEDLADHHFHSTEKRLARALLRLANIDHGDAREARQPRINQATLAEMIGTTRSRVNFFMNKFRRLGMIEYSGKLDEKLVVHHSLAAVLARE